MTLEEITDHYQRARDTAVRELADLSQGADPERVYAAMENAAMWKVVLMHEGKMAINMDVLHEMLSYG